MRITKPLPPQSILKECFIVSESGDLIWRRRPKSHFATTRIMNMFNNKLGGKVAGTSDGQGYLLVSVFGQIYKAHRIIYSIVHGDIPPGYEVDHINGVSEDNRHENLRLATSSENCQNTKRRFTNSSGDKGVYFCKTNKRWIASVMKCGYTSKKYFKDKQSAVSWVRVTRAGMHGEFHNHGNN